MPARSFPMHSAFPRLLRWFDAATFALCTCFAVLFGLFTFLVCVDIVLRKLGRGSMPWLVELVEYLMYGGTFLVAPWVLRQGEHVRVDLLIGSLPKRIAIRLEQFVDFLGLLVCFVMVWYGGAAVIDAYRAGFIQFKNLIVPDWVLLLPIWIGSALLAVEFALRIARVRGNVEETRLPIEISGG